VDTPRLDAQLLLAKAIGGRREDLAREPERVLNACEQASFEETLAQRARRRPLAYILGECWFYGRTLTIDDDALIPRPETEMLVDFIRDTAPPGAHVADVGTGSGCIAVSAALVRRDITVAGVDISEAALRVARRNIDRYDLTERVALAQGDMLAPFSGDPFDAIVSNPPYIRVADVRELMPEVRDFEPSVALYENTGLDGLEFYRRLYVQAPRMLAQNGWLAVEAGAGQAHEIASIARHAGYNSIEMRRDGAGIERVVISQWPGKAAHTK
jgi:release factor glutamine methyltransferase